MIGNLKLTIFEEGIICIWVDPEEGGVGGCICEYFEKFAKLFLAVKNKAKSGK